MIELIKFQADDKRLYDVEHDNLDPMLTSVAQVKQFLTPVSFKISREITN